MRRPASFLFFVSSRTKSELYASCTKLILLIEVSESGFINSTMHMILKKASLVFLINRMSLDHAVAMQLLGMQEGRRMLRGRGRACLRGRLGSRPSAAQMTQTAQRQAHTYSLQGGGG